MSDSDDLEVLKARLERVKEQMFNIRINPKGYLEECEEPAQKAIDNKLRIHEEWYKTQKESEKIEYEELLRHIDNDFDYHKLCFLELWKEEALKRINSLARALPYAHSYFTSSKWTFPSVLGAHGIPNPVIRKKTEDLSEEERLCDIQAHLNQVNVQGSELLYKKSVFKIGSKIKVFNQSREIKEGIISDLETSHIHIKTKDGDVAKIPLRLLRMSLLEIEA